jgi:hypothetical protein
MKGYSRRNDNEKEEAERIDRRMGKNGERKGNSMVEIIIIIN